jgi:hypothetical protein
MKYHSRVRGGFQLDSEFDRLDAWISMQEHARWDMARGISYINGRIYPSDIEFDSEEDQLVCKLMFSEMVL